MNKLRKICFYKWYIYSFIVIAICCCFLHFIFIKKIKCNDHYILREVTYIGHGTYGIDDLDYTNSVQSLELGYNSGIRIMEVDFLFTSDGELVLNHYWENGEWESSSEFLSKKVMGSYTAMDIDDLLTYMNKYEDLYIVMDTKENEYDNGKSIYDVYKEIVKRTKAYDEELLDRFIIQLYSFNDYDEVKNIYDFTNKMFSVYKLGFNFNIYHLVYYCLFNDIGSIVVPYEFVENGFITEENIKFVRNRNINIYVNTINDEEIYNDLLEMGITGVYTDFLN